MESIIINGETFGWHHIECRMFGDAVEGITEINYKKTVSKDNFYGRGSQPVEYSNTGKKTYEGNMLISAVEYKKILARMPKRQSLVDLPPFPMTVSYARSETDTGINDELTYVRFTEEAKEAKEGDDRLMMNLPFMCIVTLNT